MYGHIYPEYMSGLFLPGWACFFLNHHDYNSTSQVQEKDDGAATYGGCLTGYPGHRSTPSYY